MTETATLDLPVALVDRVSALADQLHKPRDWIIERALDAYFDDDEHRRMMLEGFASIDAGRTISHEAVVAWSESLATDNPSPRPQPGQ